MSNKLVYGSLRDISNRSGKSVAETFLSVDALVMVDTSASMTVNDCQNGQRRYDVARDQLEKLQRELPGKIGVISWSSSQVFCASGVPVFLQQGTDLAGVLRFIKPADETSIKLILISDGEPDSEEEALKLARQFKSKLSTIFVGPEPSPGREFLRKLAEATGGKSVAQDIGQLGQLSTTVKGLLTT